MLKNSLQRYSCCLPYTTALVQCTQVSRQLHCFSSKALEDFSACSGIQSSVQPCPDPAGWCCRDTSASLGGTARRGDHGTHQNRARLQTGKPLTPSQQTGQKAAFLLHKYLTSFKYCDNWSALIVTIQAQEPGLASIMNTVCLPLLFHRG